MSATSDGLSAAIEVADALSIMGFGADVRLGPGIYLSTLRVRGHDDVSFRLRRRDQQWVTVHEFDGEQESTKNSFLEEYQADSAPSEVAHNILKELVGVQLVLGLGEAADQDHTGETVA